MSRAGFSLVEVIVSVAILGLLISFIISVTEVTHKDTATDQRFSEGVRAGIFVANSLRELGFLDLVKRCQTENVFNIVPPATFACVDLAGTTITTNVATPAPGLIPLKVRVNSAGEPDGEGKYCVEIRNCQLIADGHLVAVNVTTSWVGVNQKVAFANHQIRVLR